VLRELAPERVARVVEIGFEHSPGRGDERYTGDRSAFDVFVVYESPARARGFLGIEVKYHEALGDPAADHRPRYDEVAGAMGCFVDARDALKKPPLQQIWRDHLLVGALVDAREGFDEGAFVFLAPEANAACWRAVAKYRQQLTTHASFAAWTLERVVAAIETASSEPWTRELRERYVAFERVDELAGT
jgi:hypothetical protein